MPAPSTFVACRVEDTEHDDCAACTSLISEAIREAVAYRTQVERATTVGGRVHAVRVSAPMLVHPVDEVES